jgi:hypothetical protein
MVAVNVTPPSPVRSIVTRCSPRADYSTHTVPGISRSDVSKL